MLSRKRKACDCTKSVPVGSGLSDCERHCIVAPLRQPRNASPPNVFADFGRGEMHRRGASEHGQGAPLRSCPTSAGPVKSLMKLRPI